MVRRKRPYIPKIKGCYECSQRRIDCDGTRPCCAKCTSRGIECSGFGPKFRFRNGLHGVAAARVAPQTPPAGKKTAVRLLQCHHYRSDESAQLQDVAADADQHRSVRSGLDGSCEVVGVTNASLSQDAQAWLAFPAGLDCLDSTKGFLLSYFSEKIAPEMVVVDDCFNGWRHLVLPLALSDDLIMDAVLAASAFHLCEMVSASANTITQSDIAEAGRMYYARAIHGLQNRRQLTHHSSHTQQMVVLALIVLLAAAMISGSCDFPLVFQMLQSALDAMGGESGFVHGEPGEVAEFSLRQIRKMRVYAAPLLSQDAGLNAILSQAEESFDCLYYYASLYPQYSSVFDTLADLRQQAFSIYVRRALGSTACTPDDNTIKPICKSGISDSESVERFISTLESLPPTSPGRHVLVWACFIAASESRIPEHQLVLVKYLENQYARSGFANIPRALELLRRRIWVGEDGDCWPALLPEPQVFIM